MDLIHLERGRTRVTVAPEAGGRIHQIAVRPRDTWLPLLLAPATPSRLLREPLDWGCYPMAPWPGRIDGGRFLFDGRQHAVPVDTSGHALHGFGAYRPWTLAAPTRNACVLALDFADAWEFGGRAVQEISVADTAVSLRIMVYGTRAGAMPAGAGWHPWFRRRVGDTAARIAVDAAQTYETADMVPTGWLRPVTGDEDLRSGRAAGRRRLDACYRQPRSLSISWGGLSLGITGSANVGHAVVYTPARGICIEPQTCAPDACNLAAQGIEGGGIVMVTRRRPLVATCALRWRYEGAGDRG